MEQLFDQNTINNTKKIALEDAQYEERHMWIRNRRGDHLVKSYYLLSQCNRFPLERRGSFSRVSCGD